MIKKIFILAYARKNLGDDIFIQMIVKKYPQYDFYMKIKNKTFLDKLAEYKNLHILDGEDTDEELHNINPVQYDAYIYIGGSIFMEGGKVYNLSEKFYEFVKSCKEHNIPFIYISSNYGPYKTEKYFKLSEKTFNVCTDICFRDKYSYNLFENIPNVRYAPDYIFSYDLKVTEKLPKTIGITIINLKIRDNLKAISDSYYNWIINNINKYIQSGYKIYLYSFCKHEGDEESIDYILNKMNNNENIIDVRYRGNIDEFLNYYNRMEYMICARFHAMVLSCLSNQKMYITSYSDKINNVITDLQLNIPVLKLSDLEENKILELEDFKSIDKIELEKIKIASKKQEEVLQEIMKN